MIDLCCYIYWKHLHKVLYISRYIDKGWKNSQKLIQHSDWLGRCKTHLDINSKSVEITKMIEKKFRYFLYIYKLICERYILWSNDVHLGRDIQYTYIYSFKYRIDRNLR